MDFDTIVGIIQGRRQQDTPLKRQMIEVRDRVNGDIILPLIDVEGEPALKAPSPQIISDAIDQTAMRAASTRPAIACPALDQAKLDGAGSSEYANIRRRALYASWYKSSFGLVVRRAYRHLCGYGEKALVVLPDFDGRFPRIEVRDPLTSYPDPRAPEDTRPPDNVGFVVGRSGAWLRKFCTFVNASPELVATVDRMVGGDGTSLWDVLEWYDSDDRVVGIIGRRDDTTSLTRSLHQGGDIGPVEISRWPNRAGMVPAACGRRVTLDRIASQVSGIVGTADLMDRMLTLDVLAQERAIFPDRYIIAEPGRPPNIMNPGGRWLDGRTGEINLLENARAVGEVSGQPSPLVGQMIDRLERNARVSGGNPALFGGELSGALRSGQTVNALGSFAVDPRVQELQEIMGYALVTVNKAIAATYKGYWGRKKLTLFSGWPTDQGHVDVEPDKHFESDENVVTYAFPGADVNGVTVAVGQLVGARLMSRKTGRVLHPLVDDAAFEDAQVSEEAVTDAILQGFLAQVQEGAVPLIDAARVADLLRRGESLTDAIIMANEEAQRRQAAEAPPPEPGMALPPEAEPGLAMPGMGVEAQLPPETVPGPEPSVANFRDLARALTAPVHGARSMA